MPVILELGWADTSSLAVWSTYFPDGTIVGSFSVLPPSPEPRPWTVEIGEPTDRAYIAGLIERYDPDVFIDDASHRWRQQKSTLKTVLPLLKPRSLYVVEDLHTSFVEIEKFGEGLDRRQSTAEYIRGLLVGLLSGGVSHADGADAFQRVAPNLIASVHIEKKICFIRRNDSVVRHLTVVPTLTGEKTLSVSSGGSYSRIAACIEGETPQNRKQFDLVTRAREATPPAGLVSEVRDATVYGRGVVAGPDDRILAPSLINVYGNQEEFETLFRPEGSERVIAVADRSGMRRFTSKPVVLLKQRWDLNYGHWLVESLPRLALVQHAYDLADCTFMVGDAGAAMARVYSDSLELAGIRPEQIVATDDAPCHIERLIYPHPLTVQPWVKAPLALAFLEKMRDGVGASNQGRPDRLIVVRSPQSRRRLLNQERITAVARKHGFEPLSIEGLDFKGQISAFSGAKFIIGSLGAELTNICFSPRGVALLGLSPSSMQDDFYYDLACLKAGRYFSLHGSAAGGSGGLDSDFTIDEARFEAMLGQMLES